MTVFELIAKLKLDSSEFEKGLKAAKGLGSKFASGLSKASKTVTRTFGILGATTVAFGAKAVKVGKEFDTAMSQVAATMGKSMSEMENEIGHVQLAWGEFSGNLRDYAQEMGAHTAFSAKQCAEALNYMALAGYDAQTSMEMLPNVLNLAAAGGFDLATASDMVTDTQTAFGISLERTTQMVDEMAKAASTGNTSVQQLGDAFLTVGGLTQDLNGGYITLDNGTKKAVDGVQELEIALTAMANAGIKGSEAGTHMRNMLLKLSSPTDTGAKLLENLGVKVFDTSGKMRSLSDIFKDLNGSLGSLTQEEKLQAISDLFNARDIASAESLLNAVNQDWDNIGESILNADGAAQKMADTQLDNLEGDMTKFKSALEGAYIKISDALSPALRDIVQEGTDLIEKLTKWVETHSDEIQEKVRSVAKKIKEAIKWIIDNFDEVKRIVKTVIKVMIGLWVADKIMKVVQAVKMLVSIFSALNTVAMAIGGIITGAGASLTAFLGPIAAVIAAIVAVIAIIKNWNEIVEVCQYIWEGFKEFIVGIIDKIANAFDEFWEWLSGLIEEFVNFWSEAWDSIKQFFEDTWDSIKQFASDIWDGIKGVFSEVGEWFTGIFQSAWDGITSAWGAVVSWFQGIWDGIKQVFCDIGSAVSDAVTGPVKAAINGVLSGAVAIINGFISAINFAIKWINKIPGVNISKLDKLSVPELEEGGILKKGQVGLLEGNGAEAVVPLDKNEAWVRAVADAFRKEAGGGFGMSGDIIIPVYIGTKKIEDIVVNAQTVANYRRGGR